MRLQYIFVGTPIKFAEVMWHIANKLGQQFRVYPTAFCFFLIPPSTVPESSLALFPRASLGTVEVKTFFMPRSLWKQTPVEDDEPALDDADVESSDKQQDSKSSSASTTELPHRYFPRGAVVFFGKATAEEIPSEESLLTVEARDDHWPLLQQTWDLISAELRLRHRLRDLDTESSVATGTQSKPTTSATVQQPKRRVSPAIKKRRALVKELADKGNGPKEIAQLLKRHSGMATSRATIQRDLRVIEDEEVS